MSVRGRVGGGGRGTGQTFGFKKLVIWPSKRDSRAKGSSVSPSSERIQILLRTVPTIVTAHTFCAS